MTLVIHRLIQENQAFMPFAPIFLVGGIVALPQMPLSASDDYGIFKQRDSKAVFFPDRKRLIQ
jgi:hypothetical protein